MSAPKIIGVLFGPAVGAALLLGLGPEFGIWANVLFYLPMTLLLFRTPFTGHTRDGEEMRLAPRPAGGILGPFGRSATSSSPRLSCR